MQSTSLTLTGSDGVFTVIFRPCLSPEQYAELHGVVRDGLLTKEGFCEKFEELARGWRVEFKSEQESN
jgi:hypothetical protein